MISAFVEVAKNINIVEEETKKLEKNCCRQIVLQQFFYLPSDAFIFTRIMI